MSKCTNERKQANDQAGTTRSAMSADKCKHGVEYSTICKDCDDERTGESEHSYQKVLGKPKGANRGSLLVGRLGEFLDARGRVCPCRVEGIDDNANMLRITYWSREDGRVSAGFISTYDFRPD